MREAEALVRMQEIDLRLLQIKRRLDAMPQQKRLAALKKAQHKLTGQLRELRGRRKDAQMELDDNVAAYDEVTVKMDEVRAEALERKRTYRQVQDLEAQMSSLSKRQEKLEFNHTACVENLEKLTRAEKNALQLQARLTEQGKELEASFKEETGDLRAEAKRLVDERTAVRARVSDEVGEAYERVRARFAGVGVEVLRGNVPSVCRVKLQPADYTDIRRGPEISRCPYCKRMLVRTDGGSDDGE